MDAPSPVTTRTARPPWLRLDVILLVMVSACAVAFCGLLAFNFVFGPSLHRAVSAGKIARVEVLLRDGADPNQRVGDFTTYRGWSGTPLQRSVDLNSREMVDLLVAHGARTDLDGVLSPLAKAVMLGHEKAAAALLEHGANPNSLEKMPTILHLAVEARRPDIALMLVRAGADVNQHWRGDSGHFERIEWWEDDRWWQVFHAMCEAGLDLSIGNRARDIGRYGPQDVVECALSRATKDHPWRQIILSELQSRTDEEGQRIRTSLGLDDANSPSPPETAEEGSR
jgi:ankyrin repeat protein